MKINRTGITRIVFEFKTVVIKIPNFSYSWLHFLNGIVANIEESHTWENSFGDEMLCPILWTSWGGFIVVMKRADVDRHYKEVYESSVIGNIDPDEEVNIRYKKWIDRGYGGDDKCDNYGYLNNRLVKIDYA